MACMVECFTLQFSFRKQNNSTFLLFDVLHAPPVVHLADCLHTNHVTTTGAPVRCPEFSVHCPDSYAH